MSDLFDTRLAGHILAVEGGYVNDPRDSGGETNFGITKRVAERYGYHGDMRHMPKTIALQIYRQQYWVDPGFADVAKRSAKIAEELFDTGVNAGVGRAAGFLQRALNALNNQGKLYADIREDSDIGPATLRALDAYLKARGRDGETVMIRALDCLQGAFYLDLATRRPKDEAFAYGWMLNRIGNVK